MAESVARETATHPFGIPAASDYLGYAESTLRTAWWRDKSGIPFHQRRPGGRITFYAHELDQWRARQRGGAA